MRVVLVTAPTVEPVDVAAVKEHLRIDTADDDEYLTLLIAAVRQHVENTTRRALLTQTWDYSLQEWPNGTAFKLPFGNLQSVTSVAWTDDDGTATTLTANTDYLVETNGPACGRIVLPYATTWPSGTLYPSNPITVRYVCGWTAPELVPGDLRAAIKMLVADLYENREAQLVANMTQAYSVNQTVHALLGSHRLWEEFL